MRKLLSANLLRLRKSAIFWLCVIVMAGIGALILINQYLGQVEYGYVVKLDNFVFGYSLMIGIAAAVFCSLFLGTEYSDGAIRNKLIVGHTRTSIYLSMLITSIIAAVLMCLAFLVVVCAVGIPLVGFVKAGARLFAIILLDSLVMVCATCSILTMICMLTPNKAVAAIVCILLMIGLLLVAVDIMEKLTAPEFYPVIQMSETGELITDETVPNPNYLTDAVRPLYEYALDILPTGQAYQFAGMQAVHLWQMPLYSLAIVALTTGIGMFFFRKKDIK